MDDPKYLVYLDSLVDGSGRTWHWYRVEKVDPPSYVVAERYGFLTREVAKLLAEAEVQRDRGRYPQSFVK